MPQMILHSDCWMHIFSFLPEEDVRNLRLVCKDIDNAFTTNKDFIYSSWTKKLFNRNPPEQIYVFFNAYMKTYVWSTKHFPVFDCNIVDNNGNNALLYLLESEKEYDTSLFKNVISNTNNIDIHNTHDNNALSLALDFKNEDIIMMILDKNPTVDFFALDIGLTNRSGMITERIFLRLLELYSDVDYQDSNGYTIFMKILLNVLKTTVNLSSIVTERILDRIIDMGPNINLQNNHDNYTALMIAFQLDNKTNFVTNSSNINNRILNRIIDLNPDLSLKSKNGETTLMFALRQVYLESDVNGNDFCIFPEETPIITRLIDMNPDGIFSDIDDEGYTVLMTAFSTEGGGSFVIERIINLYCEKNWDVNSQNNETGDTALMMALYSSYKTEGDLLALLDLNHNFNLQNLSGNTVLMVAILNTLDANPKRAQSRICYAYMVELTENVLLKIIDSSDQESLSIRNKNGDSALSLALRYYNSQAITENVLNRLFDLITCIPDDIPETLLQNQKIPESIKFKVFYMSPIKKRVFSDSDITCKRIKQY